METAREIFDFYIPKLIMKMSDPTAAIRFCEAYNPPHTTMDNVTKGVPDSQVRTLWNMVTHASYKEYPNPLIREMNGKVRELKEKGKI